MEILAFLSTKFMNPVEKGLISKMNAVGKFRYQDLILQYFNELRMTTPYVKSGYLSMPLFKR